MSKSSEEITKGLVSKTLGNIQGYPSQQNIKVDGITWFKEDSYKGTDKSWLSDVFATATKKQTHESKGTPDFVITKEKSNIIVVIECKGDTKHHSAQKEYNDYKLYGYGNSDDTQNYAINGALWYASFLCNDYDVVAIAVSGQNEYECKVKNLICKEACKYE